MKSKASFSSPGCGPFGIGLSGPLIKENLRRFWAVPVIAFLVYFLSGVFPILMAYGEINDVANYIEDCLNNWQPFYWMAHLMTPVITAVVVFRYLQTTSAVTAFHAMPFTRLKLYCSNAVSGLILIAAPILVNGAILLCIAKPAYYWWAVNPDGSFKADAGATELVDVFSRAEVLEWIWQSLVIVLLGYAISVLAGMIVGNSVMHLALACGFNFLLPALFATFTTYGEVYLYGFSANQWWENLMALSPYTVFFNGEDFFGGAIIAYLAAAAALFVLAGVLYGNRKLEKASDSLVFNFVIPIINYLIAFFGMSLMGFYFWSFEESEAYAYAGLSVGALIFFLLARMAVLKTPRVFNLKSLKSFAIYGVLAALFVTSFTLDLTGYEGRVPEVTKVKGVESSDFLEEDYRYVGALFKAGEEESGETFAFKEAETILAFTQLHREIIENQGMFEDGISRMGPKNVAISYELSSPLNMERSYQISREFMEQNSAYKQIFESTEFKNHFALGNLKQERISEVQLRNPLVDMDSGRAPGTIFIKTESDIKALLEAMDKDFATRTFEEEVGHGRFYAEGYFSYKTGDEQWASEGSTMELKVRMGDRNTIEWLERRGYSQMLVLTADMVKEIIFYEYKDGQEVEAAAEQKDATIEVSQAQTVVIEDKAQIETLLNTYESEYEDLNHYYLGYVVLEFDFADGNELYYGQDEYVKSNMAMIFNSSSVPDFISGQFEQ